MTHVWKAAPSSKVAMKFRRIHSHWISSQSVSVRETEWFWKHLRISFHIQQTSTNRQTRPNRPNKQNLTNSSQSFHFRHFRPCFDSLFRPLQAAQTQPGAPTPWRPDPIHLEARHGLNESSYDHDDNILIRSWEPIPNSNQQFPPKKQKPWKTTGDNHGIFKLHPWEPRTCEVNHDFLRQGGKWIGQIKLLESPTETFFSFWCHFFYVSWNQTLVCLQPT